MYNFQSINIQALLSNFLSLKSQALLSLSLFNFQSFNILTSLSL